MIFCAQNCTITDIAFISLSIPKDKAWWKKLRKFVIEWTITQKTQSFYLELSPTLNCDGKNLWITLFQQQKASYKFREWNLLWKWNAIFEPLYLCQNFREINVLTNSISGNIFTGHFSENINNCNENWL